MLLSPFNKASSLKQPQLLLWNNKQVLQAPIFPVWKKKAAAFINPKLWGLSVFILSLVHFKGRRTEVRFPLWRPRCLSLIHHCGTFSSPLSFWSSVSFIYKIGILLYSAYTASVLWDPDEMIGMEYVKIWMFIGIIIRRCFSLSLILSFDRCLRSMKAGFLFCSLPYPGT